MKKRREALFVWMQIEKSRPRRLRNLKQNFSDFCKKIDCLISVIFQFLLHPSKRKTRKSRHQKR